LVAGEGHLPLVVAQEAKAMGHSVQAYALEASTHKALKAMGVSSRCVVLGQLAATLEAMRADAAMTVVFAGKVNKWQLFTNSLRLDALARQLLMEATLKTDDGLMHTLIAYMEQQGFAIMPQTRFMAPLFQAAGVLTPQFHLHEGLWKDVALGHQLAKTMGAVDVGQTVVVNDGMPMAVEAIEGTDACLLRAGQLARKRGGVVVKVAKPQQDDRFDVPTVGLRTLKTMKKAGLTLLATEANATLFLDAEAMVAYAQRHHMGIISYDEAMILPYQPYQPMAAAPSQYASV
jgi:DUF1009 family protein